MAQELNKGVGGSLISSQAKEWIKNYTEKNPNEIRAHFFGSDIIESILAQPGCVGIRMYYALDEKGTKQLLLVGAKENGNNIWPSSSDDSTPSGIIADNSWPCPMVCNVNE